MGAVERGVSVVPLEAVDPISLPMDSWSRMVLTEATVPGAHSSMGYSVFKPGTVTAMVSHTVEELAFVIAGHGELRLEGAPVRFGPGQGLHIPAGTWHAVAATSDQEVIMVFAFPHPDYPPTERR